MLPLPCFLCRKRNFRGRWREEKDCRETTGLDKGGEGLGIVGGGDVATGVDGDGGCSVVESQLYVGCVLLHFEQVSLPLYFELEEEREEDGQRKEVPALL